jgi:hypothetical protein
MNLTMNLTMNIDACPVAELGRLMDEQFDAVAAAEQVGNEYARRAADALVSALCIAQTTVQATSWRGVMLQLIELDGAADGIFSDPDIYAAIEKARLAPVAEKLTRLIDLIRQACDALAPETADLGPRVALAAWQLTALPKAPTFARRGFCFAGRNCSTCSA